MTNARDNYVAEAFDMILMEVEGVIKNTADLGAKAFQDRNMEDVKICSLRVEWLTSYRVRLAEMCKEWYDEVGDDAPNETTEEGERRSLGRLRKGERTPEFEFYLPILQVLTKLGGSAKLGDILPIVGELMQSKLHSVDFDPIASDPDTPRWRNTAQWARYSMVQEGLLAENSKRGVWVMTEKGRRFAERAT